MRNPPWDNEEEILLVNLYFDLLSNNISIQNADKQILKLSQFLNKRARLLNMDVSDSFRNTKGIKMKLGNIQFVDTLGKYGLSGVSLMDKKYVDEYKTNNYQFAKNVHKIKVKYSGIEVRKTMCVLVEELKKLKKSSEEAVDNEKELTSFKKYMHIHRQVEDDLVSVIKMSKSSSRKSLILVCGNVGDGKSHLISYVKHHEDNLLDGFFIHNDATESRSRNRNEREELAKVLDEFNDDNIDNNSAAKVIVAINLGVLSNFIDSEEGSKFTRLAKYISDNKILVDTDMNYDNNSSDGIFYHVNFGDYHIYRISNEKVDSPYISDIIDKIFTDVSNNDFYGAYLQCNLCDICDSCPVKKNYEMLGNALVKKSIINVILETIIKDKIILSTRDLLNFFYDIIVHPLFDKKAYSKFKGPDKYLKFIEYSLLSIMYEHDEISSFMTHIKQYDFITQRTEALDEVIIKFNTSDNVKSIFSEYIEKNSCMQYVLTAEADFFNKNRSILAMFFSRLCKIAPKCSEMQTINLEFIDFISDLYYANKKDKSKLKNLYATVKNCIYLWNGSQDGGKLNLNINHEDYVVSTSLDLVPDLSTYNSPVFQDEFERFPAYITVSYCLKNDTSKYAEVSIDYDLYKMLKKVENGYRPSAKDNNYFVGFVSFINKLASFGNSNEEIFIRHYVRNETKEYILKCDEFGTYEFKEVK